MEGSVRGEESAGHRAERRRVAITGYGAICSLGENSSEIWEAIMAYRVGYRRHEPSDSSIRARFFGFLDSRADRYRHLPRTLLRRLPEYARLAMVSAHEAVEMAFGGSPTRAYDPFQCGVAIGTGWGGLDSANCNSNDYRVTKLASSHSTIMSMNNVATAALSMHYKLRGYQTTPVAACASGAIAIGEAIHAIQRGDVRCMLAGGSESLREAFNVWSIDILEALTREPHDPQLACCPFNLGRSGFVLSEGAAVLCLEDLESARERGAQVLAELSGYGNYSDGHDFTAPVPDALGRVHVIRRALENAGRAPSEIDYINAHGTSTPLNDVNESQAIKAAFGEAARKVHISSTKSYTGHLIGAAGAIETLFCTKAIENQVVPATLHLTNPDPACDLDYTPNEHLTDARVNTCMNLSFGFGGANAALVIERATPEGDA